MMRITQELKRAVHVNAKGMATFDVSTSRRKTWCEFANRIAKLAGALQAIGLKKDDRVAIISANSDYYLEYYFATIWAGGIFLPLNIRLAPQEIGYLLNNSGSKILVIGDRVHSNIESILEHPTNINHLIFAGEGKAPNGLIDHETVLHSADPVPDKNRGGDDIATIIYTGGTTGEPKGVMLTHNNILSNAQSVLSFLKDDNKPSIYLHAAPMYHIADFQWNTGATMLGGTHVFLDKFDPEKALSVIDRLKITHTALVPTMIKMLCDVPTIHSYDLSSLRKINFGGSPISTELIQKARKAFPDCEFIQGYGLTETSPNISMLPDIYNWEGSSKIESAGRPVRGMSVKIVDENGGDVPRGTIGEIITKGLHVMAGYWNNPVETNKVIHNGWLHTGDAGYMDEHGFIFIVDRLKDMIITGGENVYSAEVEAVIEKLDGVGGCAVFGVPDEKWGEAVYAIVVPKENQQLSEQKINDHCRKYLADYKCPKRVEISREPLPKSGSGKILKRELRKPFWLDEGRQIN